jgi:methylenetetrahydrofolate--tRNA-(uracil-5-)-methyltransferase
MNDPSSLNPPVTVIGGGLAGCEAAWQLALRGVAVDLYEMRPERTTSAHESSDLAELVCSNSLRSSDPVNAAGLLKSELSQVRSFLLMIASGNTVPAGTALAVDRIAFSREVTCAIERNPLITLIRREITDLEPVPGPVILAAGPLASDALSESLSSLTESEGLYFYDALAPIIEDEHIDRSVVFPQSRYDKGGTEDYLNCPFTEAEYHGFVETLVSAGSVPLHRSEEERHFSGCMPVEVIAKSGPLALAHGPMKPVGLIDPRTGDRPFAVVQLRRENLAGTAWNLVGFQTRLTWPEQKRVFRTIPGLSGVHFHRLGSMHRNTFIDSPRLLDGCLCLKSKPAVSLAGQITGVEGYIESIACGWLAAFFRFCLLKGCEPVQPPRETALGAILNHLSTEQMHGFQPSNINYGLFPPAGIRGDRKTRRRVCSGRALDALRGWISGSGSFYFENLPET